MLEPPIGFIRLNDAGDLLRGKLPPETDVQRLIATACVQGKLTAAYRRWDGGADELEPRVWQLPHWRSYFDRGIIRLELPLLDERGQPLADGRTAPNCEREIFIASDSLTKYLANLGLGPIAEREQLRNATHDMIRQEVRDVYLDSSSDQPNVNQLAKVVRPRLNQKGFEASDRQIRQIGEEREFTGYRRKPGKTKASERPR